MSLRLSLSPHMRVSSMQCSIPHVFGVRSTYMPMFGTYELSWAHIPKLKHAPNIVSSDLGTHSINWPWSVLCSIYSLSDDIVFRAQCLQLHYTPLFCVKEEKPASAIVHAAEYLYGTFMFDRMCVNPMGNGWWWVGGLCVYAMVLVVVDANTTSGNQRNESNGRLLLFEMSMSTYTRFEALMSSFVKLGVLVVMELRWLRGGTVIGVIPSRYYCNSVVV